MTSDSLDKEMTSYMHDKAPTGAAAEDVITDIDEINELAVVAEGEERTTWFVWILVMCSTISGLLFGTLRLLSSPSSALFTSFWLGYDTGVISGALVTIGSDLGPAELSNGQKVCFELVQTHYLPALQNFRQLSAKVDLIHFQFPTQSI